MKSETIHKLDVIHTLLHSLDNATLYDKSIHEDRGDLFFMVRNGLKKQLVIVPGNGQEAMDNFNGTWINSASGSLFVCPLNNENAAAIRSRFAFTNPVLIGKKNSYGFGDRLGNAGPAHLRAVLNTGFKPVLAQQSIRELERTNRTAAEVLDAATWAVFQEGYHDGFGADGDHLKNFADIDRMAKAGYTMFTIDPGDYVQHDVQHMSEKELTTAYENLPWAELNDSPSDLLHRYSKNSLLIGNQQELTPGQTEIKQAMVKYGRVISHTKKMSDYILETYPDHPAELELSVDETDEPTTLFEHYLIASELTRLGVELVSLAPRFCGHFEKGIDFKGDLDQFKEEYKQHLAIAGKYGGYKLSIHSGSDKFSVYEVIGSLNTGVVHVKTAGTSYLEALRTVAEAAPDFFRDILKFSLKRFETDKKTYHISADPSKIPDPELHDKSEFLNLLDDDNTRQVLHVAFGSVLSGELPEAENFRSRLMDILEENEELHEQNLYNHFKKHLNPFNQQTS